jgi:hypothetical protein
MVDDVADTGTFTTVTVRLSAGPELRVRTTDPGGGPRPGDTCGVDLDQAAITLWPTAVPVISGHGAGSVASFGLSFMTG